MSVLAITVRQSPAVRLACYHLDGPGSAQNRVRSHAPMR
jgi:hypothetical protein